MTERLFPILGTEDIPLVGRAQLLDRIWSDLTKPTPSNLSVVGPRYIGKTVLLKALADRARETDSPYKVVVYWEVGCNPPQSDDQFRADLCDQLHHALGCDATKHSELRTELAEEKSHSTLKEVLDWLDKDGDKVLMIWDGFDKPLSQGHLTAPLFGQLRSYFNESSHTIVTAARALQSELAADKKVEDSPFWNMFDLNPVRVGPLETDDFQAAFKKAGFSPQRGGEPELKNWTGGHPILFFSMLNQLHSSNDMEFDNTHVNNAAKSVGQTLAEFMDTLWASCSADAKATYRSLVEHQELACNTVTRETQLALTSQSLASESGSKLKPACKLIQEHVQASKGQQGGIKRGFATSQDYESNIRELLELRLSHAKRPVNNRLHKLVRQSISHLPDDPDDCLNNLTRIEELSLDVVWQFEANSDGQLPADVISAWTSSPCDRDRTVKERMDSNDWRIPSDRLQQILILERLTGSRKDFTPLAKKISKDTYVLLNAIHSFRNRTEHTDGQQMPVGVAASALLLCIELLSCLEKELA
ncbi:ATP-binding protein [Roseiconus lacunae]|uniref:ATP-binding protein n=1 Tax=Roseiconus lacunae TaxID=2605694 RepID=UPI001E2F983A|nr:ATP-binding protein [Roseiconus lacunae]MCD0458675.1 ATP-binding protein [Roseiconus lacunae]